MSGQHPEQCNNLRIGGFAIFKGRPCKIVEMSKSKPGKHGAAKINLVGIDIFTGKKYEEICPSTHSMEVPDVNKNDVVLIDIDDEYVSIMNEDGTNQRNDLKVPAGELGENLRKAFDEGRNLVVTVQAALGEELIIAFKDAKGGN